MNEEMKEKLSSLIDDEHDSSALDQTLNKLCNDEEAKAQWARFHLARDVMQREYYGRLDSDFSTRIRTAIDQEIVYSQDHKVARVDFKASRKSSNWLRPVGGLALAATVAAVSVMGLRYLQPIDPVGTPAVALNAETVEKTKAPAAVQPNLPFQPTAVNFRLVNNEGTYWTLDRERIRDKGLESRLNSYLSDHIEFATMRNVGGMLPYSRLVGYDEIRK